MCNKSFAPPNEPNRVCLRQLDKRSYGEMHVERLKVIRGLETAPREGDCGALCAVFPAGGEELLRSPRQRRKGAG